MKPYFAIDIGTNSCRLLIAENRGHSLHALKRHMEITRIGEGLYASQRLQPAAITRTLDCLRSFQAILAEWNAEPGRAFATAAVRDALNGIEFLQRCQAELGLTVELLSSEEEARLSYRGALQSLELNGPPLLIDLGGGSCEFIRPDLHLLCSLALGAVRAYEQKLTPKAIATILQPLQSYKHQLGTAPVVIVGGTASSLVAIHLGLEEFCSELIQGQYLSQAQVRTLYQNLSHMSLQQLRQLPGLQPERADIIVYGTMIMLTIMEELNISHYCVSESDLMEGAILSLITTP